MCGTSLEPADAYMLYSSQFQSYIKSVHSMIHDQEEGITTIKQATSNRQQSSIGCTTAYTAMSYMTFKL
jgi:hypothetical protein